jgi:integrase
MEEGTAFISVAENWLKSIEPTVSKNTYAIYNGYVKNYMLPYFEGKSVEEINAHIAEYIEKIESNERAELIKKFYPVFSMILDYAEKQGFIGFNYAKVNAPFAKDEGLSYSDVGIDELAAILAQAKYDDMLLDFALILDLGLSRGEILGLKWGDVDFNSNTLMINRLVVARNGATCITDAENKRKIAFMDITAKLLTERKGNSSDDEFIISSPASATSPFNPSAYRKKIAKITGKALGGDSITIELIGFSLSVICDCAQNNENVKRENVLTLALEKSQDHSAIELKYRKAGTGYVSQLSHNCWQGRYTPTINGKRISRNIYASTEEECEKKLAEMIKSVKIELG